MLGWVSSTPVRVRELLGDAAIERLLALSSVHRHGWGMAWHDDEVLSVRRSSRPACEDEDFVELVDTVRARSALVHIRMGTPGYGRGTVDTHPFSDDTWALIHNGAVAPSALVGALLPPGAPRQPDGSTDSERWFIALRAEIDTGRSVPEAVAAVIERAHAAGLHASSWNSMLLGPDALSVVIHHDPSLLPVDVKLWPDLYPEAVVCWPPYFDLRWSQRDGATIVASSGIVDDMSGWPLLPNMSVARLPLDAGPAELTALGRSVDVVA
jgi:hypothetical protein